MLEIEKDIGNLTSVHSFDIALASLVLNLLDKDREGRGMESELLI